jgi:ABC-type transport system involved in multi-copper enzyme maturation permease subunit
MQAIATKELRSRMRGGRAFGVLTVYLLLLSCLVVAIYWFIVSTVANVNQFGGGGPPPPLGKILFYGVTLVELLLIAPLAPSFSASAIAGERERQTFDLVMTTPIRARDFVLGKLASGLSYVLLLIFVALPVQVLALLFGGLTLTEVLLGFWILIIAAVFYASVSLFFSSVMRTTTTASIFSYLVVAMSLIGALLVFLVSWTGFVGIFREPPAFLFEGPPGHEQPRTWAVYLVLLLISLSPLTAGGATAIALNANEGTFWFRLAEGENIPGHPNGYFIISPWLVYTAIYLGLSVLCILMAMRYVRPTGARNPGNPSRPPVLRDDGLPAPPPPAPRPADNLPPPPAAQQGTGP